MDFVVVTRHPALIEYMREIDLIPEYVEVITHVTDVEQIKGNRVYGILPFDLAQHAESMVTIPLNVPAELRGTELTVEQIRQYAGTPQTFIVKQIPTVTESERQIAMARYYNNVFRNEI